MKLIIAIIILGLSVSLANKYSKGTEFEYYNQKYPKPKRQKSQLAKKFDETINNMHDEIIKKDQKDSK